MRGIGRELELTTTSQLDRARRFDADEECPEEDRNQEDRPRNGFQEQQVGFDAIDVGQALGRHEPVLAGAHRLYPKTPTSKLCFHRSLLWRPGGPGEVGRTRSERVRTAGICHLPEEDWRIVDIARIVGGVDGARGGGCPDG